MMRLRAASLCILKAASLSVALALIPASALFAQNSSNPAPAQAPAQKPPVASVPPLVSASDYFLNQLNAPMTLSVYLDRLRREFRIADADADGEISEADVPLRVQFVRSAFRASFLAQFMRADLDGDGVVTEDELRRLLTYDRSSANAALPPGKTAEEQVESQIRQIMVADADHDGRITFAEVLNYVNSLPNPAADYAAKSVRRLLALAPAGKTVLTLADFEAGAEALFHAVDADGDGTVSSNELLNYRRHGGSSDGQMHGDAAPVPAPPAQSQPQQAAAPSEGDQPPAQNDVQARLEAAAKQREIFLKERAAQAQRTADQISAAKEQKEAELRAACAMPKASDAAKVVVVSGYGPEALSRATIGSQDVAVRTGNIHVEPGKEPIYLVVVSFDPAIWRFSGAVGRIERLVLTTSRPERIGELPQDKPVVGATNIPADRITFLPPAKCIQHFIEPLSGAAATAIAAVKREVGKDVATVAALYSFSDVAVPSGKMRSLRGPNAQKVTVIQQAAGLVKVTGSSKNIVVQAGPSDPRTDLKMYSPGGVVEIDPRNVIAALPVERYEVLPEEAGLVQLLGASKIARNKSGEYLIKKKIRFPADLYGAHAVKFLLLRGVPAPDGDPGHSTVVSQETGQKI